jgi:DNA-binding transcriptional MerR regulator
VSTKKPLPSRGPDVLTIKETAKLLGVSEVTLRRWDKAGKFSPHRHPLNGYRCYRRDDVLRLRRQIETGKAA